MSARIIPFPYLSTAGRSAVASVTTASVNSPQPAGAVVTSNSVVADVVRGAPALLGATPVTSAASSDVADFSDAAFDRAWLLQPGASELPRTLPFSKNAMTFLAAAASAIQFASSSSAIPTT